MKPGDIIGVAKAARGNTGAKWLEAKILWHNGFYQKGCSQSCAG